MKWRVAAIPATMIPIVIIAVQFDVKAEDLLSIGALPFAGAVAAIMTKLALQGAKFYYIARAYIGKIDTFWRVTGVRMGSEFIKFTTPMFVGAEFVMIYWLHKKGVSPSKASWIAIMDIVTEVFAAGLLSIMAGVVALLAGAYVVAAVILGTSISITGLWIALFFLSSKRTFRVPGIISSLAIRIGKQKAAGYVEQTNTWISEVCTMSRENLRTSKSKRIFLNSFGLSLVSWIFYGISFMIIAHGAGYLIGAFDSVMAVMGANAIGNLPITIGGSGLAELGVVAYLGGENPFVLDSVQSGIEWDAVIGWRIATYYVPIAVTWMLLMRFALGRYSRRQAA